MPLLNKCNLPAVELAITLTIGVGWVHATTASAASIPWYGSVEEASTEARLRNRPIMLDFWADWCVACKVMESEVYTNSDFVQASEQFLAVRINSDKKPTIARKYHITALPTLVFTDSYGNELFRYVGTMAAKPLTELLRALPHDVSEFNRLNQILAQDKNNFEALEGMGKHLRATELYRRSNDYYQRAFQQSVAKTDSTKRQLIMLEMAANYLEMKDGKRAAELFEKCLKEFPSSPQKQDWATRLEEARGMAPKKE
jgi:thioredoxin-like negative regulator of GroEL